jgi:hypothetical protein
MPACYALLLLSRLCFAAFIRSRMQSSNQPGRQPTALSTLCSTPAPPPLPCPCPPFPAAAAAAAADASGLSVLHFASTLHAVEVRDSTDDPCPPAACQHSRCLQALFSNNTSEPKAPCALRPALDLEPAAAHTCVPGHLPPPPPRCCYCTAPLPCIASPRLIRPTLTLSPIIMHTYQCCFPAATAWVCWIARMPRGARR